MSCQHPGKILLQQYLKPQKISQNRLARAIRVPPRRINEIIHQKRAVTADTAVRLGIYFGNSASYWLHLQAEFDIEKIRQPVSIQLSSLQNRVLASLPPPITTPPRGQISRQKITPPDKPETNKIKKRIMR